MSENVGESTSRNPKGLHGLYGDNFTLPYMFFFSNTSSYKRGSIIGSLKKSRSQETAVDIATG
jgi:hypothetical protein